MSESDKPIVIGDTAVRIHPDMAWERAARVGDILADTSEAVPAIMLMMSEFDNAYRQQAAMELVPDTASEDELADALASVEGPPLEQQIAVIFPAVWKVARSEILQLLAILTTTDQDLFDADDKAGDAGIEERLNQQAKLLRRAKLGDLIALAIDAIPAVMGQIEEVSKALGENNLGKLTPAETPEKNLPSTPSEQDS